jgi:hypothetical protein
MKCTPMCIIVGGIAAAAGFAVGYFLAVLT